ncbi:GroES-like protein [Peniophora sp. CONT]|nr:GroES-like protein [Peniophora sp. CONT]
MAPSTHAAAVVTEKGDIELRTLAIPKPDDGEVLVKVIATALNPADWKSAKLWTKPGVVAGNDFAGVVDELGPGAAKATGLKVGDRVATFATGGAYAEYVVAKAHFCIALPETWTFEQGAQLGIAIYTTFQTLYQSHDLPTPLAPTSESIPLLVYGASSAVGLYVVQVAKAAGLKVYALCSPKNFELVKSFGADEVYDYRDKEASNKIKAASGGKIQAVVDTIGEYGSVQIIVPAMSSEGGKIATIWPYSKEDKVVLGSRYKEEHSLAYDLIVDRPDAPSHLGDAAKYAKLATQLLASGILKPIPIRIWDNGLEGINAAMQYMMDGKVSGEKIVFRITDTPGLA